MIFLFQEWTEIILRWFHVIAGIAWIGSSFYFIALDLSLKQNKNLPDKSHGEAWQVHGGGFYHLVKYLVAPSKLPSELTWFKWEAYATWVSGFALLALIYYAGAELYMIDIVKYDLEKYTPFDFFKSIMSIQTFKEIMFISSINSKIYK